MIELSTNSGRLVHHVVSRDAVGAALPGRLALVLRQGPSAGAHALLAGAAGAAGAFCFCPHGSGLDILRKRGGGSRL